MLKMTKEITINAPVKLVFSAFKHLPNLVETDDHLVSITILSAIKEGVGVQTEWKARNPDGTLKIWREEITGYKENEYIEFKTLGPNLMTGKLTFTPTPKGTHVVFTEVEHYEEGSTPERKAWGMTKQLKGMKQYFESLIKK
ncbi:MAG: SRPBCC family protein [Candidatus Ranarchaeia archaeon]